MPCEYSHNGPDPESKVDYEAGQNAAGKSGSPGDCCSKSNAHSMVRDIAATVARQQGGTDVVHPSGSKGNTGQVGLGREQVNCDPQGFRWTDVPRLDRDGG